MDDKDLYSGLIRLHILHHAILRSKVERDGRRSRRVSQATPRGRKVLLVAKEKVRELFGELLENE